MGLTWCLPCWLRADHDITGREAAEVAHVGLEHLHHSRYLHSYIAIYMLMTAATMFKKKKKRQGT